MPKSFSSKSLRSNIFVIFFILLGDQLSKFVIVKSLQPRENIGVLPFLNMVRVENKGITFGLLSGTLQPFILIFVSLIIIVSLCLWMRNKSEKYQLIISLIIGGAIGNLIDRFVHGAVIDFLDFHLLTYHWPAFNIADSAIVVGVFAVCLISRGEEKI
jgi:signal peptidase II